MRACRPAAAGTEAADDMARAVRRPSMKFHNGECVDAVTWYKATAVSCGAATSVATGRRGRFRCPRHSIGFNIHTGRFCELFAGVNVGDMRWKFRRYSPRRGAGANDLKLAARKQSARTESAAAKLQHHDAHDECSCASLRLQQTASSSSICTDHEFYLSGRHSEAVATLSPISAWQPVHKYRPGNAFSSLRFASFEWRTSAPSHLKGLKMVAHSRRCTGFKCRGRAIRSLRRHSASRSWSPPHCRGDGVQQPQLCKLPQQILGRRTSQTAPVH
jgi:hypothetical protein